MTSEIQIITADSLWAQHQKLKAALKQTELMLTSLGEKIPENGIEPGSKTRNGKLTLATQVQKSYPHLVDIPSAAVVQHIKETAGSVVDPNAVSGVLGKDAKAGKLKVIGKVDGSEAIKYAKA